MTIPHTSIQFAALLKTPLGPMLALSDETALCHLEFIEEKDLKSRLCMLENKYKSSICQKRSVPILSVEKELNAYFEGRLKSFETPCRLFGTPFQKRVWSILMRIPYGETRSYTDQAAMMGAESAFRAVANANGANRMAIIIPCHRIINKNGKLGGYAAGIDRKKWLLNHEVSKF